MSFTTAPVKRGDLTVEVSATGTLQPLIQVDISSELSGVVRSVNVDENDTVKKGDVLAELDTCASPPMSIAPKASVKAAEAQVGQAQTTLKESGQTLSRAQQLSDRGMVAQQALDTAQAARDRAVSAVAVAEANLAIAEAELKLQQADLQKSTIYAPVDGIVLKRAVEPGQTVASSLQAPVLFTLAEDLKHMQLKAISMRPTSAPSKPARRQASRLMRFRAAAFPARIETIEFSPLTTDGVVTYKAVLSVDNSDLALRPGMTATAQITVQEISNALLVPNAALRYSPPVRQGRKGFSLQRLFMPRMPRRRKARAEGARDGRADRVGPEGQGSRIAQHQDRAPRMAS